MKTFPCLVLLTALGLLCENPSISAQQQSKTYTADADWIPVQWLPNSIVPGSALDFSCFLDAPAGKHGRVIIRDGQFVFERTPDRPVQLYGTVARHALPYVDKAKCEILADSLAASGYGAVRLHNYTFAEGVLKEIGSAEFSAKGEDQLDYFFYSLKKRGIYYTLPINSWGFFKAGDVTDVPEFRDRAFRFESNGLLPISQDAQRWFKEYARRLLCHTNPYTGMAMKDDPALLSIELANEDSLHAVLGQYPDLVPAYRRLTRDELRTKLGREPSPEETDKELPRFVLRAQEKYVQTMKEYLRRLGLQQPVTSLNFRDNQVYALARSHMDYVDAHSYWALYQRRPNQKDVYGQNWGNPNSTEWSTYLGPTASRLFGKPYMSTEFNGCYPTPFWIFTGPLEATLAGSQGWNGVFRYGQASFPEHFFETVPVRRLEVSNHPIILFSERIGAILFGQNEIKPLPIKLPFVVTRDYLMSNLTLAGGPRYPQSYPKLAFRYQLGTVVFTGKENLSEYPAIVVPDDFTPPDSLKTMKVFKVGINLAEEVGEYFRSLKINNVPQFSLDAPSGMAQIATPRSQTFLLPENVKNADSEAISVNGNNTVSVCFAGSLDHKALSESERMLVLFLTDLKNTDTKIEPDPKKAGYVIVRDIGRLPLLVQQAKIEMTFRRKNTDLPEIWALRYDGARAVKIEPVRTNTGFSITIQAVTSPDTFAAYELIWKR